MLQADGPVLLVAPHNKKYKFNNKSLAFRYGFTRVSFAGVVIQLQQKLLDDGAGLRSP